MLHQLLREYGNAENVDYSTIHSEHVNTLFDVKVDQSPDEAGRHDCSSNDAIERRRFQ